MKVPVEDMKARLLDYAMAVAEGLPIVITGSEQDEFHLMYPNKSGLLILVPMYHKGEHHMRIRGEDNMGTWSEEDQYGNKYYVAQIMYADGQTCTAEGPTMFIAACRCYVRFMLGDYVDIPNAFYWKAQ